MSLLGRVSRQRWLRFGYLTASIALVGAVVSGCSEIGGASGAIGSIEDVAHRAAPDAVQPALTMNPQDGAVGVAPSERVTAVVASGQLAQVDLRSADGGKLDGVLSPDGERWTSSTPLRPDTSYTLTTVTRSVTGEQATSTARFSTQSPGQQVRGKITPANGTSVGTDKPVVIDFDKPIANHRAVEQALRVSSNPTVSGRSRWQGDRQLVWQPDGAWPEGSEVTASLDFYGRAVGPNLFGAADERSVFRVAGRGDADRNADRDLAVAARDDLTDPAARPTGAPHAAPRPGAPVAPLGAQAANPTPKPAATPKPSAPAARSTKASRAPSSAESDSTTTRTSKPARRSNSDSDSDSSDERDEPRSATGGLLR
ncbi:Ig-like domain-containing protein [Pseudonocardia spinosispora]|uniref:Ig-like domain-containing protein n=1 Tax=Pseudonocardia spinosispora TaxID=103441 RepID=UPI0012EB5262|nr:Ig-like domain-containing protein [Pseudonocardia spinosispora]